ncbi:MAG: hypothetical protein Q8Q56_01255, partial [Alphaproteobacteria bacterium]|nr:hypothetical protein [Alphaproteobacteria bacterium]
MKKLIRVIASLKIGVSSIVIGAALEGGGYLVGIDRPSNSELRLVREGSFEYNLSTGRFEDDEVVLLGWPFGLSSHRSFNLEHITRQVCLPTTEIELSGNLSSGKETPVGSSFIKRQRIFDSLGKPHKLIFTFTRLAAGLYHDNRIQYS